MSTTIDAFPEDPTNNSAFLAMAHLSAHINPDQAIRMPRRIRSQKVPSGYILRIFYPPFRSDYSAVSTVLRHPRVQVATHDLVTIDHSESVILSTS